MDVIQGSSIEEEKDCQNTSWIPITPGKPSGSGSPDGAQNPGSGSGSGSCCSSTNSVTLDDTKSEIYGGGLKLPNDFSSANVQRWSNVSFGDLLALAHAGGTTSPAAEIAKDETACSVKSPFEHVIGSQSADDSSNFPSIPSQFEPVTPDLIKSKGRASNASNEVGQNKDESALVLDQSELQENNKPDNISPDKPRRRKHRPKVVIEGKPKRTRRPRTEKTEKRKYVRKNKVDTSAKEVNDSTICQEGAPKETPTVKRKYVRKNQVIKSTEKPSAEEGSSETIDPAKETPTTEKRKRIRRKVNKITEEKPSEEGKIDPTKISLPEKPCRRSLNFELESLVSDETGSIAQSAQLGDGMEAVTEVTKVGVTHEEMRNALSPPTPYKVGRNHDNVMGGIQDECTGGTCRIDFADSKGLKRPYSCDKAQLLNARGVCFNSIQAYRAILPANGPECSSNLGVHFPAMYKKTRIEKGHSPSTFFIMPSVTNETNHHAPSSSGSPSNNSVTDIAKEEEMLRKKIAKKQLKMIDDIAERLQKLDLNRENGALVLYKRDGSIVPFVRKRKARPKVDVDDETDRVWKLLLLDINSEGIDGTDEDKAKWWEEERRVFNSRADSFIARMRLVQGDRRFSPWKGSVVDSVVGVFLTQNVSDHLSSSAFMSLAAHFPLKSNSSTQKLEQSSGCIVEEPEVCETDPNVTNTDSNEEKETVISSESSEISRCCIKSDSSSTVNSTGDQRETNDFPSSPSSVVSSETSTVTQVSDRADSSNYVGSTSFLKLLQMVGTSEAPIFSHNSEQRLVDAENDGDRVCNKVESVNEKPSKEKKTQAGKVKEEPINWDSLRVRAQANGKKREKTENTMDSLDWEAVRRAHVDEVAHTIRERGMNNKLAERIKAFLDRIVSDHGSLDLEWLRDVPPDKAKEYLLSVRGLGLKSVECVRLLTLHHLAFPVDTNVGRIAVRLGWVPLQPLPESLQLHLLELYPILESIQKFLWPRLCKLDQRTLYELHYHMITFGKVFCTKSKPNCNACPMRGECRHFASAFASARLALPAPEEKSIMRATENGTTNDNPRENVAPLPLPLPPGTQQMLEHPTLISSAPIIEEPATPESEPIVEVPTTPEQEQIQVPDIDIEDACFEDPSDEIPMIELNMTEFTQNVKKYVENNMVLREVEVSNALVALTSAAASIPMPKLKNYSRLRTEHQVYELPDSHPLLEGLDKREPDDPCSYLLAIWTPGETANSMQPPERKCDSQESGMLCDNEMCSSCNSIREANSQTVRGTLLIPCRTAMRGSFPLNGTYFQVNEVFADHDSSLNPINVPRDWLWNLPRRTVYFGTSIPTIFKGLTTESIQHCFWRGFVCVRGFDQKTRAPRPLKARLHFPASKLIKTNKGKTEDPGVA